MNVNFILIIAVTAVVVLVVGAIRIHRDHRLWEETALRLGLVKGGAGLEQPWIKGTRRGYTVQVQKVVEAYGQGQRAYVDIEVELRAPMYEAVRIDSKVKRLGGFGLFSGPKKQEGPPSVRKDYEITGELDGFARGVLAEEMVRRQFAGLRSCFEVVGVGGGRLWVRKREWMKNVDGLARDVDRVIDRAKVLDQYGGGEPVERKEELVELFPEPLEVEEIRDQETGQVIW